MNSDGRSSPADARLKAAVSHWGPRFVSNGVPLPDFQEVCSSIERWADWCRAWSQRAHVHELLGIEALESGHGLSAGEHLNTAAVCYHFAKFLFVNDPEQMRVAHKKAVECRNQALPHLVPPGERVEIPVDGGVYAGILRKPAGVKSPPVVVMVMGLDSAKEEMAAYEKPFLDRGVATLAFDGPGQGEGEYEFKICPEYEHPMAQVLDWLEARDDVDRGRVGVCGVSLGGYYAPRAAAFHPRIKACISLSGPYDFGEIWPNLPELTKAAFIYRAGCSTDGEGREYASRLSLAEAAPKIACPLFVVAGKRDRIIPWQHGERLAKAARGEVKWVFLEEGNHVANNRAYQYRPQMGDWMAEKLRKN